jgi:hypothetical protein
MSITKIAKLAPQTTALFICDVQERFKGLIWQYPSVISVAGKMVKSLGIRHIIVLILIQLLK